MYFITKDVNDNITGVYNGDMDYTHRITGEPIRGARPIPDDSIRIDTACYEAIRDAETGSVFKWDSVNTCVVIDPPDSIEGKRRQLMAIREPVLLDAEKTRIEGLTETELNTELGI